MIHEISYGVRGFVEGTLVYNTRPQVLWSCNDAERFRDRNIFGLTPFDVLLFNMGNKQSDLPRCTTKLESMQVDCSILRGIETCLNDQSKRPISIDFADFQAPSFWEIEQRFERLSDEYKGCIPRGKSGMKYRSNRTTLTDIN